jgi:concentrative nucleoside transporter, CNT family
MERLISALGLFVMIFLAWLMSSYKRKVSMRVVIGALLLQFIFALLILKTAPGQWLFDGMGNLFNAFLDCVDAGAGFVFGPKFKDFYFAFKVLPTIIFFSSFMAILYYIGLMQWVVTLFGRLMQVTLGTSGAESLSAAANIFLGQTEAPLVVRPYVATMTKSELMAVMVPGFGSTAGGVLAAYVGMGVDAGHLITASVMSAPAGLLLAKVMLPETEHPRTTGELKIEVDEANAGANVVEAAAIGATEGMKLAINVAAMLIAFLGLIAVLNLFVGWVGGLFGQEWSLAAALSYLFAPLAWIMGIQAEDCLHSGKLLGLRMVANEFIAYEEFSRWIKPDSGVELADRSQIILTYALSGFANFGSIGIQIGGIGAMAPERQGDLARLGLRAMLGGTLATFMTACIAGILI